MRFKIMGKWWRLVWVSKGASFVARSDKKDKSSDQRMGKNLDGLCEAPWLKKKRIFLRHGIKKEKGKLEPAIHEFTHAADWSKDEEWVNQFGHDLANFLYTLGWRCTEEPEINPETEPESLEG